MSAWLRFAIPIVLEMAALSAVIYSVHRAQKSRIYPAFWQWLIFWLAWDGVLLGEGYLQHLHLVSGIHAYEAYFYTYWPCFVINGILMLRVLHEMFRHAVRSIPGVQKLGRPIFFWAIVVSVVLSAAAAGTTSHAAGVSLVVASAQVLMRSEAVLALCMLSFLAFASHTLGVSFGSRIFGVTFGFGLMATADLVNAAILTHTTVVSGSSIMLEVAYLAAMSVWAVYFLKSEPARRLVAMPTTSPLMRWNDIALTLGNPAGQVAINYPPSFMRDVTELVESVMGPAGWPGGKAASSPPGPIAS
jgi:hypothetical protein